MSNRYIYILVRRDIPTSAQIIQVAHAVDRIALRQPFADDPANVVLFEVEDENQLLQAYMQLRECGLTPSEDFEIFYDTAWPKGFNAIASRPMIGEERNIFAEYSLYRTDDKVKLRGEWIGDSWESWG